MSTTTTQLENGWTDRTPVDDTLLRRGVVAMGATWEATAAAHGGRILRHHDVLAADLGRPSGIFNSAVLLRPAVGDDLGRSLDEIEAFYAESGTGTVMLWSPWPLPDLGPRGWALQGHPPLLHRDPAVPVDGTDPDELSVVEVSTDQELRRWCTVVTESFPFDDVVPPDALLSPPVLDDDRFRFLIGSAGGRDVVAGSQTVVHDTNVLLLSAARPAARGHGYYSALVRHRLLSTPGLTAVAVVSDHSRPVLTGRFGFAPVSRLTSWSRARP